MKTFRSNHFVLACALITLIAGVTPVSAAKFKCWTNNEGVKECGNAVPPEYAQQGHETIGKGGLTLDKKGAARTVEELKADRDAEKLRELEIAEQQKREQADRVLLDTFASEDDLVLTRDGQLAHLDSQMRLTESHIEKLQANLDKMIERAADVERRGEVPSDEMVANIKSVRDQIAENEAFIATKENEKTDIRTRFARDIERFLELKKTRR